MCLQSTECQQKNVKYVQQKAFADTSSVANC